MIQDIAPYKFNIEFKNQAPKENDYILYFKDNKVLLYNEFGESLIPTFLKVSKEEPSIYNNAKYLFSIDEKVFFMASDLDIEETDDLEFYSTEIFRELKETYMAFAGTTGSHIYQWYISNKFCGKCGSEMLMHPHERAVKCTTCNTTKYPQISPAIIVGIIDGDKILLTKYAAGNYKKYALVAGYTEVGETLEDTVRREVMEEVGLKVKDITYYKSQPWGFSQSLLTGFFAKLDGSNEVTLEDHELSEGTWVSRDELPDNLGTISLTAEMIHAFRDNLI